MDKRPVADDVPTLRAQLGVSEEHLKNPPVPPAIAFLRERLGVGNPIIVEEFKNLLFNPYDDVHAFHVKYGIDYQGPPRKVLPDNLNFFRIKRLKEELQEYIDSTTPQAELDALVDLIYIALGTCDLHGWDFIEAWRRVHAANMAKERANNANPSKYGVMYDVVKPKGWIAPNHDDLVGT